MSYIGSAATPLPVAFSGVRTQSFNGTGSQTAFTLSRAVSAVTDIEVVVNNVQQNPYDSSYNISGATLTFSEAPSSGTNNIYVIFRDQPVGSLTDPTSVKKAGDTMTGDLFLDNGFADGAQVVFKSAGNTDWNIDNYSGALRFYNGSTVRAQIDASGRLTLPYQPAFRARSGAAVLYTTTTSDIPFSGVSFNDGEHFVGSTGVFTAPVAGRYAFFFRGFAEAAGRIAVDIRVNGVSLVSSYGPQEQGDNCSISTLLKLAASDQVSCRLRQGTLYCGDINNVDSAQFAGYLVG